MAYTKAFLMTYKSFTTVDELFDLLVERFRIQPPANMTSSERDNWGKHKQHIIQTRSVFYLRVHETYFLIIILCIKSPQYF
jgi:son of sevenless-like protein